MEDVYKRQVIGWDELTNSSFLPEESIILGWQGMGTAALKAAETVSYTHLDVYKRQPMCRPLRLCI